MNLRLYVKIMEILLASSLNEEQQIETLKKLVEDLQHRSLPKEVPA